MRRSSSLTTFCIVMLASSLTLPAPRARGDEKMLAPPTTVDRILETVERFEEDLTDAVRTHRPIKAVVEIGESIPVDAARGRAADETLMATIEERLRQAVTDAFAVIHKPFEVHHLLGLVARAASGGS